MTGGGQEEANEDARATITITSLVAGRRNSHARAASTLPAVAPAPLALKHDTFSSREPACTTVSHEKHGEKLKIFHGTSDERGASGMTSSASALSALPE